ncbi:MAG TPA: sugar phosphate isomerase/epimerase family protein [Draconibacterium sp.]|nr:sugar phosphate isomerase/epimerase family protein [Draconibacterium sp.]
MKKIIVFSLVIALFGCSSQKKELDNTFYCFNNGVRTLPNAPQGVDAQAEFIKRLGFDGLSGHISEDYLQRRKSLDKVGLKMPEIYWGCALDSVGNFSYKDGLKEVILDSKDRDLVVALFTDAKFWMDNKETGDELLADGIRDLADFAAPYNVRIAIYPHVNNYVERSDHAVKLVKQIDRTNVGAIFNTCHLLKVEGEQGWEEKLLSALPFVYMISINGADSGNTKEMDWDRLIQPLGEGTFDTWKLVKLAKDNGYEGLFGLQCYNIKQDCEVALTKSINTWRDYMKRYAEE